MKTARIFILIITFLVLPKVSALADHKIDILTIGSSVPNQILSAAHKLLSRKGFSVGKDDKAKTAARTPFSIYMNTDEERFKHFLRSILSKSRVLWAARGGYGSQAVLRKFSKHPIHKDRQAARKFLIGSSDLTAAGLFMAHHHDWIFLHGPMLMHNEDLHSLRFKLTGSKVNQKASLKPVIRLLKKQSVDTLTYTLTPINAAAKKRKRPNTIQGPILGGNLSVIQRNIGGILKDISFDNVILFLEDVNEPAIVLREKLEGLLDTGRFHKVKAIIFGNLSLKGGNKKVDQKTFYKLIGKYVREYIEQDIPIYEQSRFGHGPYNDLLPMNVPSEIVHQGDHTLLKISLDPINRFLS